MDPTLIPFVFGSKQRARLTQLLEIDMDAARGPHDGAFPDDLEVLITGWGTRTLDAPSLDSLPHLKAIVHWGGGVDFIDPVVSERSIQVSSARTANAVPVAEFTLAMITLAAKNAFWAARLYGNEQRHINREVELADTGLAGTTVGIVGASTIGSLVIKRLRDYDVEVLVYDPFLTSRQASKMGAELVGSLEHLAGRSRILSIHAPDIPHTRGMVSRDVLRAMPDHSTLINTARGALVDQDALIDELAIGRLRAILDVTQPDVLPPGHPLYTLPNAFLTPHLAGSMGNELRRLGTFALEEIEHYVAEGQLPHAVAPEAFFRESKAPAIDTNAALTTTTPHVPKPLTPR